MVDRALFKNLAEKFVTETFEDFTETFTIEESTPTDDGRGGQTDVWTTFATITGFVTPEKGSESLKDDRVDTNQMYKFAFQHIDGVTTEMRVNYNGDLFNITSVESIKDQDIWINVMGNKNKAT